METPGWKSEMISQLKKDGPANHGRPKEAGIQVC